MTVPSAIARKGTQDPGPRWHRAIALLFWLLAVLVVAGTPDAGRTGAQASVPVAIGEETAAPAIGDQVSIESDKSAAAVSKLAPPAQATGESADDSGVSLFPHTLRVGLGEDTHDRLVAAAPSGDRFAAFHQRAPPVA